MSRNRIATAVLVLVALGWMPAAAAAQSSLSINVGYFTVRGFDGRVPGDTLVANLDSPAPFALDFRLKDFNNATIGAEWLFPIGTFLEGGVGVSYYQRTVASRYADLVNDTSNSDISQDLRLRVVPITATVRFLPLGRRAAVQPYIGAGIGVLAWSYRESGDFVDASYNVFSDTFSQSGTAVGPVIMGGVRVPLSLNFALGGEVRYQKADASLDANQFAGNRIDLSGVSYQANFVFRF